MTDAGLVIVVVVLLLALRSYEINRLRMKASLAELHAELKVAARIQRSLLPARPPQVPGYDLAVCNLPHREVGGDYTDFIKLDEERLAICHGDVAGKGLPAALLMASFQAVVRGQAALGLPPADCARGANRALFQSTDDGTFASLFYCILDHRRHLLRYCNAGHEKPILLPRAGEVRALDGCGMVLGVVDESAYADQETTLGPGDLLVLYSDGVTDAEDRAGRQFGEARLQEMLRRATSEPAAEVVDSILRAVRRHVAGAPLPDDLSILAIKRLG